VLLIGSGFCCGRVGVAGGDAQRRGWAARAIGADVDEDPQQPAPAADVLTSARFAAALASVNRGRTSFSPSFVSSIVAT